MTKEARGEIRRPVDGEVVISWRDPYGLHQFSRVLGVDLSTAGVGVESSEPLALDSYVLVNAEQYGISGLARVRHCAPRGRKYLIGLELYRTASSGNQPEHEDFVDYYELMQLGSAAELETIHRVFKILATRYHPDNVNTGDNERFLLLKRAFDTLSDPAKRAAYDAEYEFRKMEPVPIFELKEFVVGIESEVNRRLGILCLLYNRRRSNPDRPGLSLLEFEQLMRIPREHLVFTIWYLKEKQLLRTGNNADFEITALGIEFVETSLPSNSVLRKLLSAPEPAGVAIAAV
jgi:hypothetical protein